MDKPVINYQQPTAQEIAAYELKVRRDSMFNKAINVYMLLAFKVEKYETFEEAAEKTIDAIEALELVINKRIPK